MSHTMYSCGDVDLDVDALVAFVAGDRVILTMYEFETLRTLIADPGRVFTRKELCGRGARPASERAVDARIVRLRRKLRGAATFSIETVPFVGYRCWASMSAPGERADDVEVPR